MAFGMKISLKLSQKMMMTPMLQQALKMLPMAKLELIQSIRQELEENPLLEELLVDPDENQLELQDDQADSLEEAGLNTDSLIDAVEIQKAAEIPNKSDTIFEEDSNLTTDSKSTNDTEIEWDVYMEDQLYDGSSGEGLNDRPSIDNSISQQITLNEVLMRQLTCSAMNDDELKFGEIIIGNLNSKGYLDVSLEKIAEEHGADIETVEDALILVQSFYPSGIAARNLRESLMIQLLSSGYKGTIVEKLVRDHLEDIDDRKIDKLSKLLDISADKILKAFKTIRSFDPEPGSEYNQQQIEYINPDLQIVKVDNEYHVYLVDDDIPKLRISPLYRETLKTKTFKSDQEKDAKDFLNSKYKSALWLINSIEQRKQTMLKVGRSLCKFQKDFLDKGISHLKPLVLRDIASDINMHESTISRVTTNKYVETPQGLFEMKFFFHSSLSSSGGDDMSSVRVKELIKQMVKNEDSKKPLTDEQIALKLAENGIDIARRTVSKYRKELKISSTSKRRKLYF